MAKEKETILLFLNAAPSDERREELEKEISYKTGKNIVILDARFKNEVISL